MKERVFVFFHRSNAILRPIMVATIDARDRIGRCHLLFRWWFAWCLFLGSFPTIAAPAPISVPVVPALGPLQGDSLVRELGCVQCHTDLPGPSVIKEQAPDLSDAGLRYRTEYLFAFLQRPQRVRRHIGRARMPDFHLNEKEALALALFLESQQRIKITNAPTWPAAIERLAATRPAPATRAQFDAELNAGLACLACHSLNASGGTLAPELADVGHQLQPAWIARYLVSPQLHGVPTQLMPAQFYQLSADQNRFEPLIPDPDRRIATIVGFLAVTGEAQATSALARLNQAKAAHREVMPAQGEQLFRAFNCVACHRLNAMAARTNAAPALGSEGLRVRSEWLGAYLKNPTALRPSGFHPGDGSRMPNFRLSEPEATALAEYLSTRRQPLTATTNSELNVSLGPNTSNDVARLSAFSAEKARRLLTEKLSCLGCHRLDSRGGVLGPALEAVGARLQPNYIAAVIQQPRLLNHESIMPKIPMPDEIEHLLIGYLAARRSTPLTNAPYLSPLEAKLTLINNSTDAPDKQEGAIASSYRRQCAPCHGLDGRGDGFNAAFLLPARPTSFADAKYLSSRPGDTLFDGIHSGGAILNRSPLMPPWGATLPPDEIRNLVKHLRSLCACEGPDWSRDGNTNVVAPRVRAAVK